MSKRIEIIAVHTCMRTAFGLVPIKVLSFKVCIMCLKNDRWNIGDYGSTCRIFGDVDCEGQSGYFSAFAFDGFDSEQECHFMSSGDLYWREGSGTGFSSVMTRAIDGMNVVVLQ